MTSSLENPTTPPAPATVATASSVDKSETRIRTMFGEISPRYDFLNHFLSGGTDIYWRWRTVRAVPPRGDAPMLDVCTGTGDLAIAYWKKGRGRIPVIGADFTHEMLRIARTKGERVRAGKTATEDGKPQSAELTFLGADTQHLPFADNSFQLVSVAFGLRNVTNTMQGLREMVRVCLPGGRVAILEFSLPTNRLFRSIYSWYFRNILPRIGQLLMRNRQAAYEYLPQSVAQFPQGEQLCGMLREAGLEQVTWTPLTFGIATLYVGVKPSLPKVTDAASLVASPTI